MPRAHPTAVVDRGAVIADDVEIGPYCIVDANVRIGAGTRLLGHVVVSGRTTLGSSNVVHPFVVLGGEAQVRRRRDPSSIAPGDVDPRDGRSVADAGQRNALEIGSHNVFRESVTINASSGEGATRIGSDNLLMAGCHVGHDVVLGSHCVVANGVQLAGHVTVEDWVTFGGLAAVAQHLRVGQSAFVAAGAMCERDVPPFVIAQGDRARVRALNVVGLERRGVDPASIQALRIAFARLWGGRENSFDRALEELDRTDPRVTELVRWLEDPARAVRPARRSVGSR